MTLVLMLFLYLPWVVRDQHGPRVVRPAEKVPGHLDDKIDRLDDVFQCCGQCTALVVRTELRPRHQPCKELPVSGTIWWTPFPERAATMATPLATMAGLPLSQQSNVVVAATDFPECEPWDPAR